MLRLRVTDAAPATLVVSPRTALELAGVLGLYGWRGMPDAVRLELAAQAQQALADPGVAERLRAAGMEPREASTPAAFAAELAAYRGRWAALARQFGARPPG